MPIGHSRVALLAALHFLIFSLIPTTAPSNSMAVESMTFTQLVASAPSAAEIALFEELADWIGDDQLAGDQPVVDPSAAEGSIRRVIRARATSFDFFRSYHDDAIRYQRLDEVPFGDVIRQAAEDHGVDALLVAAIIEAESSFDPCAISHRGAVGLMQVMPATAGGMALDRLTDPSLNVNLGTGYLRHLLDLYEGDLELSLAAYNAGPANVRRYGGLPPFRETRHYVERVLGTYVGHHQEVWRSSATGETLGLTPLAAEASASEPAERIARQL